MVVLGLSGKSQVSHSIASMESDLGVALFTRGRHGATLTFVGV
ncbi:MAG: LysR family transcriptional regulator [Merismopedia sp. SIO2A8]|nr:LysR family transcriptional regulator [Merismopedia sp. SIO2A8]